MNKSVSPFFAILCAALIPFSATHAREVSMVAVNWQPYVGSDLQDDGMIADVARMAFERVGHSASVEFIPWTRALKSVAEGEKDIALGAYYSDERTKTYIFSDPFYRVFVGLIARRDVGIKSYKSLEQLRPYRIGLSRGWANSKAFDAADFLNKDIAKNPTINLQKLQRNRIDMMVAALGIFRYELNQAKGDVSQFEFLTPPLAENALYLLASKKSADGNKLIEDFNRGLKIIQQDGTYDKILQKHGF